MHFHEFEEFSEVNEIFESVFVEIETKPRNTIVGCIYRPPNSNLENLMRVWKIF